MRFQLASGIALALLLQVAPQAATSAAAQTATSTAEARPNVIWLLAEDMGPELGILATPELRTPNLDQLARDGMLFTHAFTTSPVCSTSRSAFNTGMYQTTIGAQNHRSHRPNEPGYTPFPLPDGVRLISDRLGDAGYFTANVVDFPEGTGFTGTGKTDWNFTLEAGDKPFDSKRWSDLKSHQPFFAQVNFPETHRGPNWDQAGRGLPHPADPARVVFPPYYPDVPEVRKDWAQYLDNIMALDRKVGEVRAMLKREGLADNTVIVFMGDNGRAMVRGKQWPYDSGLHVPLVIYWPAGLQAPEGYRAGITSDQLISAIDLTATTLAFAGIQKPAKMQGRVFLGAERETPREYLFGARDRGDETVDRIRTVRSQRYRYLRNYYPERPFLQTNRYKESEYPVIWVMRKLHQEGRLDPVQEYLMAPTRPREELYDLEADPFEIHNLATSPAHAEVLQRLRSELDAWIARSDDQGRFPEDPRVIEFYDQMARQRNGAEIEVLRRKWGITERAPD